MVPFLPFQKAAEYRITKSFKVRPMCVERILHLWAEYNWIKAPVHHLWDGSCCLHLRGWSQRSFLTSYLLAEHRAASSGNFSGRILISWLVKMPAFPSVFCGTLVQWGVHFYIILGNTEFLSVTFLETQNIYFYIQVSDEALTKKVV